MPITYNPKLFSGDYYAQIYSETLTTAKTLSNNYVHIMPNVKTEQFVTTFSASITEQDYASDFDPATADRGSVTISDEKVMPLKKMFFTTVDPETLRFTRFGDDKMGAGARNLTITEFENKLLDTLIPQMARSIEVAFWSDIKTLAGTKLAAGNKIAKNASGLTVSNIYGEMEKVWKAIPSQVRATGQAVIYADESVKDLMILANLYENYKEKFIINGDSVSFLGTAVLFVPLGANTMFAGNKNEVVFATDVVNDEASIEIGKLNNYGDKLFFKSVYTRDKAIVVPSQKILYS
ncbi:hypothetical protein EFA69_06585 [Rufibacter immobilis]|uniref:Uncharacterized protein n=1 Tax=Rufibacter immobilis TaxID=1348778 RepID=A0A3M9MZJ1_9BACT|nr:hypothetical protein [Rufibacter immobilis]RNI30954.1 hypothetical protein EFA69_06585 [Rufibacter immobilis]